MTTVKMTELEEKLLSAVWYSNFHDGAFPVDNYVWTNCVTETLGKSAQGAITSGNKKGWTRTQGETKEDRVIAITLAGAKALAERDEAVAKRMQQNKEQNARDLAAAVGPAQQTKPRLTEAQAQAIKEALQRLLPVVAELQKLGVGSELDEDTVSDYESDVAAAHRQLNWLANELYRE